MTHRKVSVSSCINVVAALLFIIIFTLHLLNAPITTVQVIQPAKPREIQAIQEPLLLPTRRLHRSPPSDSVLLPDWQALVLLPPNSPPPHNLTCHFPKGHVSPARLAGALPSGGGAALCTVSAAVRRLRPLPSPLLIDPSIPNPPILRYDRPMVYESISTESDVVLFAKGLTKRPGFVETSPAHLRCAFLVAGDVAGETLVTTAAQGVFRCPHPTGILDGVRDRIAVTLNVGVRERKLIPLVAFYRPPPVNRGRRSEICACTMVRDVAKFLPEWVTYHSGIGVDRFVLYDNGSEDQLEQTVNRLTRTGFKISTRFWPWPKTQEAGFAHCAIAERHNCEWVMFADVDEFIFSPSWSGSPKPSRAMFPSLLPTDPRIGQLSLSCRDFAPSGLHAHPSTGVTQGYTCRLRREERHKSILRVDAVAIGSLMNSVHHFWLEEGWQTKKIATRMAVVNHYKYQAWNEFKKKFQRRVSAYVANWRDQGSNLGSKDRTPGLGFEAVEPEGWADRFCEVNDTQLRDATRQWFGSRRADVDEEEYMMAWEEYKR